MKRFGPSSIAFGALAAGFTWQAVRTSAVAHRRRPQRLVAELRLAQMAALLLTLTAGAYIGFAVVHEARAGRRARHRAGGGLLRGRGGDDGAGSAAGADDPGARVRGARRARRRAPPGWLLPDALAPRWYSIGCAVYDVYIGALCYLPILRR